MRSLDTSSNRGRSNIAMSARYVHPNEQAIMKAFEPLHVPDAFFQEVPNESMPSRYLLHPWTRTDSTDGQAGPWFCARRFTLRNLLLRFPNHLRPQ